MKESNLEKENLRITGAIPIWIQDGERGAQAVTNGGVLEVRRSEARRTPTDVGSRKLYA